MTFVVVLVSGCGLSPELQERYLSSASDHEVCYAAADMRDYGFAVRRRAAEVVASQRGLKCDYEAMSRMHAMQRASDAAGMAANVELMKAGAAMANPPQPIYTTPMQTSCIRQGAFINCRSY